MLNNLTKNPITKQSSLIIGPDKYGVSFSTKQCRNFKIEPREALDWLISNGWRRFRLMSYWDEHEKAPDQLDFKELDKQIRTIRKAGGQITLCVGARQPRWPENHWPNWVWRKNKAERTEALLNYVGTVVSRYRKEPAIISWQLENEALLKKFGKRPEVDRSRLRAEFSLIKSLDSSRPIVMTTSTSWGIPLLNPIPDIVGFSFYQTVFNKGAYSKSFHKPWLDKLRSKTIKILWNKPAFIHELQCEPWGPKSIWEMSRQDQSKSMSHQQISTNLKLAKKTQLYPIDLWGGEWWYWRHLQDDDSIWQTVKKSLT